MNRVKRFVTTIMLLTGFGLSAFCLTIRLTSYETGREEYRQLQEQFELAAGSTTDDAAAPKANMEKEEKWTRMMTSRNPDYVFWIWIPGTNINYPTVKNTIPGYYLNHTFSGEENPCGTIFCLEEAENQIIYGHNMKDGSMFADLKQYRSEAYFQNHRSIWIYRQGDWQQYVIFSCYTAREEEMGIYQSHFISEEEKQTYLKSVESKTLYTTGSQPEITDSLITLSTCLGKGKRVIVHAVLLCYTE